MSDCFSQRQRHLASCLESLFWLLLQRLEDDALYSQRQGGHDIGRGFGRLQHMPANELGRTFPLEG